MFYLQGEERPLRSIWPGSLRGVAIASALPKVCQCIFRCLRAIRDTRGMIEMVIERGSRRVLGVSMCNVNTGEVIHVAAIALRFGASAMILSRRFISIR